MDSSPLFLATSGPTKRRKHYFWLLFSQYWTWAEKSQWSRHLFEKSIPGLFYSKPPRKVSATELELRPQNLKNRKINRPTCFQTLTFCRNLSFQKSWICPWISKDFPPHGFWIFGEAAGAADKKTRLDATFGVLSTCTACGGFLAWSHFAVYLSICF